MTVADLLDRPLGVLRLSLTARCNLACPYCLPDGQEPSGLLSLEQRLQVAKARSPWGPKACASPAVNPCSTKSSMN
jgi:cyclic pyranopterin phosphate synthase